MADEEPASASEFRLTYYWAGEQRTVRVFIPRWVLVWILITIANAFGLTEPAKELARHLFGMAGCS